MTELEKFLTLAALKVLEDYTKAGHPAPAVPLVATLSLPDAGFTIKVQIDHYPASKPEGKQ